MVLTHAHLACVIPVGPEEPIPQRLIQSLLDQQISVTVSATIHRPAGLSLATGWISGTPGRAAQLNRGIEATSAPWLWLIHADSELPTEAFDAMQRFCRQASQHAIGHGYIRFAVDGPKRVQLNAWAAYARSRWLKQPYGDQTFCIHRALWQQLKGFDTQLDRGEDLDFVIRARTLGAEPTALPFTVTTSARRYRSQGWLRTTIDHQIKAYRLIQHAKRWRP